MRFGQLAENASQGILVLVRAVCDSWMAFAVSVKVGGQGCSHEPEEGWLQLRIDGEAGDALREQRRVKQRE